MKKFLKGLVLACLMLVMLFSLTGCGNKLVATKDVEESGIEYKTKMEITFKKDNVDKVKLTCTTKNEDDAKKVESSLHATVTVLSAWADDDLDYEITRKGKKVVMKLEGEAAGLMASDEGKTKDEIREELEEDGFKVK